MTTSLTPTTNWTTALSTWTRALGCLGAAALVTRPPDWAPVRPEVLAAAREVLVAAGLDPTEAPPAQQLTGPLAQVAALAGPGDSAWLQQSDAVLLAQGRSSGQGVRFMAPRIFATLAGLTERLGRPGAAILDVGTGVAAIAAALAEQFPAVTVTGLDVSERVLALARAELAGHPAAVDRVRLRKQDVATLDEREAYDLAWIPAPFVAPDKLTAGVAATAAALRPGGWLLLGRGDLDADQPVDTAVARLTITAWGGTALTTDDARQLLAEVGLMDITTIATPPGAPAMTAGRRP
jgi:SAM-dependent methyltransferase